MIKFGGKIKFVFLLVVLSVLFGGYSNCSRAQFNTIWPSSEGGGTTVGNPTMVLQVASYNGQVNIEICVEYLEVKTPSPTFSPGPMNQIKGLTPAGSSFTSFVVPSGNYTELDLILNDTCGTGFAVQVENAQGQFRIPSGDLVFLGNIIAQYGTVTLSLNLEQLDDQLAQITQASEILPILQTLRGSF